jgi:predicted amino acid-binding ACT domain protein
MRLYRVTVTAADRVGIVESVTGTVHRLGGNVLELSQTVMRGFFTILLAVAFDRGSDPDELARTIAEDGRRFEPNAAVREVGATPPAPPIADGERFLITVIGQDQPGNIHRIAGALAEHGVNIVDLHARGDGPTFSRVMEAYLPADLPPSTVRGELERFGHERGLESYVQHEDVFLATTEPRPVRVGPSRYPEGATAVVPH